MDGIFKDLDEFERALLTDKTKSMRKEKIGGEKLKVPEIINTDLTYYMQFGWKRLREPSGRVKKSNQYLGNVYEDNFPTQED